MLPMAHGPVQLTPDLYTYYQSLGYREPAPLAALRLHFQDHPQLHKHTLPEVAQFLVLLVQISHPRHILELGTFIGYSTLAMAMAMPLECHLTTCDTDVELAAEAQVFWEKSGHHSQITFKPGPAQHTLDHLQQSGTQADFIYIDANKAGYENYYESALQLCPPGGLIVLDNTLSAGQVIHPHPPAYTQAIQQLNTKIHQDRRVDMLLLPLGDGVTVVRKRG
jgi:predicted O-methyltransferase YrrM